MKAWKLKTIANSYVKTQEFRFNNYVVNPHIEHLMGDVGNKVLLEVGCGFGRHLEILYKKNPLKLVGCDISIYQIKMCRKFIKNSDIVLHVLDFSNPKSSITLGQNEYDVVYNVFVILYINPLDKLRIFIENCYKCLKKNGKLLICTLDISSASFYPEVFKILNFPTKPLENNKYCDGCPIQIGITEDCVVTSYQRNFDTLKELMEATGFKNVRKYNLFLDEIALQAFTDAELNMIKKSNILLLIKAEK